MAKHVALFYINYMLVEELSSDITLECIECISTDTESKKVIDTIIDSVAFSVILSRQTCKVAVRRELATEDKTPPRYPAENLNQIIQGRFYYYAV